jgi:hypothetical protein
MAELSLKKVICPQVACRSLTISGGPFNIRKRTELDED